MMPSVAHFNRIILQKKLNRAVAGLILLTDQPRSLQVLVTSNIFLLIRYLYSAPVQCKLAPPCCANKVTSSSKILTGKKKKKKEKTHIFYFHFNSVVCTA